MWRGDISLILAANSLASFMQQRQKKGEQRQTVAAERPCDVEGLLNESQLYLNRIQNELQTAGICSNRNIR